VVRLPTSFPIMNNPNFAIYSLNLVGHEGFPELKIGATSLSGIPAGAREVIQASAVDFESSYGRLGTDSRSDIAATTAVQDGHATDHADASSVSTPPVNTAFYDW
jgi:hypothetical protein